MPDPPVSYPPCSIRSRSALFARASRKLCRINTAATWSTSILCSEPARPASWSRRCASVVVRRSSHRKTGKLNFLAEQIGKCLRLNRLRTRSSGHVQRIADDNLSALMLAEDAAKRA